MNSSFFSFIIPVYNTSEEYLNTCVESLMKQTFSDIEIILVDDGSREECAAYCDALSAQDQRIRVIHKENQGVSMARNDGIAAAVGEWIMFADADDWLEEDACEKLRDFLMAQECDMLMFDFFKEYENRQVPVTHGLEHGHVYDLADAAVREYFYRRVMKIPGAKSGECPAYYSCDKVIKRSLLTDNHLVYPKGIIKSEDKIFILECIEKLGKLLYVKENFYHYRQSAASACHRYSANIDSNRKQMAEMLMKIAGRMDAELGSLTGNKNYHKLTEDCEYFVFGVITDVLLLKYYHEDYPGSERERRKEAIKFLKEEPFRTSIRNSKYSSLSMVSRLKKLLLSMGFVSLFSKIIRFRNKMQGEVQK